MTKTTSKEKMTKPPKQIIEFKWVKKTDLGPEIKVDEGTMTVAFEVSRKELYEAMDEFIELLKEAFEFNEVEIISVETKNDQTSTNPTTNKTT